MCSIRGLWVIQNNQVILSRRYPTVENRVTLLSGLKYSSIPSNDAEFLQHYKDEILKWETSKGIPIVSCLKLKSLWPVISIKRLGIYFVCLLALEDYSAHLENLSMIDSPFITAGVTFLEDFSQFVCQLANDFNEAQISEVQSYLCKIAPFGKPMDTNMSNICSMVRMGFPSMDSVGTTKRPAWKPYLYKGKQKVEFLVQDRIQCVQYDKEKIPDVWNVSGSIMCKADLENFPEVTATIIADKGNKQAQITHFTIDPCVQSSDAAVSAKSLSQKICFTPPLGSFTLCKYGIKFLGDLPLRGFYQMKERNPTELQILIQLKLSPKVNNAFQYCEVMASFQNRGNIIDLNCTPTAGIATVYSDRKSIKWNIGHRFTGKNLEVALPAIILFDGESKSVTDPFLVGSNTFVQVHSRIVFTSRNAFLFALSIGTLQNCWRFTFWSGCERPKSLSLSK